MAATSGTDIDKLACHFAIWDDDVDRLQALLMKQHTGM
jgi:hypothetical protein